MADRTLHEGVKDDQEKLRYDLIPALPLAELAARYTGGADKYEDRNWERGMRWGRPFAAMMRHAWAWWQGEMNDPEWDYNKGKHHLAAVAWCAFTLLEYDIRGLGTDDRPYKETHAKENLDKDR